ncbi:MAG: DUF3800 domain-containing protein [Acidimicrobiales bacterium]
MPGSSRIVRLRRDHPTSAAFLDETGAIAKDPIFGIGLLKVSEPSRLLRRLQKFRDQTHWYNEIRFSSLTRDALPVYKRCVDVIVGAKDVEFFCFMADRRSQDPVERFGTHWDAYTKLSEQLVVASIRQAELMSLMADNYSTPDHVLFEEDLRARVNRRLGRLAVVSVCRLDSRSSDGLQAADLLTSAVAFEFRSDAGLASPHTPKAELAQYVRQSLGAASCLKGWRNASHSVQLYEHGSWQPSTTSEDS